MILLTYLAQLYDTYNNFFKDDNVMTLLHDMMLHDDASYCHLMMALTATFAA